MYIEIKNVSKTIKNVSILKNVSVQMNLGRIYGLKGKNGSGKTMLMRVICGLVFPTEGEVWIKDEQLGKDISFPRSVGAMIENPGFIEHYDAFDNLRVLASLNEIIDDEKILKILNELGLDAKDKKKVKKYSLGMRQKLGIAAALMEDPELIVLDEPINALDEESVNIVKKLLFEHKKRGACIIISCHDREELEFLADEIFELENGKIINHYFIENEQ